jgi:hypothetical protein
MGHVFAGKRIARYPVNWIKRNWNGTVLIVNAENLHHKHTRAPDTDDSDWNVSRIEAIGIRVVYGHFLVQSFRCPGMEPSLLTTLSNHSPHENTFGIYLVKHPVDYREVAVDEILSTIKPVDQWGDCGGKNGTLLHPMVGTARYHELHPSSWKENPRLFRQYRFCMVMENSVARGYITEKITQCLLGGCIPIY